MCPSACLPACLPACLSPCLWPTPCLPVSCIFPYHPRFRFTFCLLPFLSEDLLPSACCRTRCDTPLSSKWSQIRRSRLCGCGLFAGSDSTTRLRAYLLPAGLVVACHCECAQFTHGTACSPTFHQGSFMRSVPVSPDKLISFRAFKIERDTHCESAA